MGNRKLDMMFQSEQNRLYHIYYPVRFFAFQPNYKVAPLTGKFYSRHKELNPAVISIDEPCDIKPKPVFEMRTTEPETTNQEYGWCVVPPLVEIDRSDHRFFKARWGCEITRIEALIKKTYLW